MAHKVIVPPKKNYIPQFLKQRDINSYKTHGHVSYPETIPPVKKTLGGIMATSSKKLNMGTSCELGWE